MPNPFTEFGGHSGAMGLGGGGGGGADTSFTEITDTYITGSLTDGGSILKTLTYGSGFWRATLSATGAIRDGFNEWAYKEVELTTIFSDFDWSTDGIDMYIEPVAQSFGTGSLYGPACAVLRNSQGYGIGIQDHAAGTDRVYKIISGTIGSLVAGTAAKVQLFYCHMWNSGTAGYASGVMTNKEGGSWIKRTPGESGNMGQVVDSGLTFRIGVMTTSATPPGEDETLDFRIYARKWSGGALPS